MGKASSAKKVARAARAGGRVSSGQPRSLLFPSVLLAVIVLGMALVIYARDDRRNEDLGGTPQLGDHIHQAFGINVCGTFLDNVPEFESAVGIHTHGDGVLHIHPFSQLGVGANATLERFLQDAREGGVDVSVSNSTLKYLDKTYKEGDSKACDGVDDPQLRMAYWKDVQASTGKAQVTTGDFGSLRLTTNGAGITLYFGDPKADIPKPPTAAQLAELGAKDTAQVPDSQGSTTSTSTGAEASTSTTTGEPSDSSTTSTTAAGDTTTTAAP